MASNGNYVSDVDLRELYNSLEKESLVTLLIAKYRLAEEQREKDKTIVKKLNN